jgi:hypothetical protein
LKILKRKNMLKKMLLASLLALGLNAAHFLPPMASSPWKC